ncbi:MFS transporter [Streptomyces koyangensis]|uniref:MFS transporter n=1 Tax=Streptomyces TaxID=1883 RepID=UPI0010216628|nr:MFS transporter [Streptomyces sp. SCA2-2]RZE94339.1 MFS transporter [Streptomyces sp. SCA2-2]
MSSRHRAAWPLVALFTAGYLASYLLPTLVGRLDDHLPLTTPQAGVLGSVLLLCSASAGFLLASRVERLGARRLSRAGLLLMAVGYGTAAATTVLPLVAAGAAVGGFGSGTTMTVATGRIAARRDPHRASTLGLLAVSATAGALYLILPALGGGHGLPLAAVAVVAVLVWPATGHLPDSRDPSVATLGSPLPHRRAGGVLAGAIVLWALCQNALWGVSGRIGTDQAGLSEAAVGAVFAAALGAGLLGILGASALGARFGRAAPIGVGTVLIAGCIAASARADGLAAFATGEIAWNTLYPAVLSYLIGLGAHLDPRGRWAVMVGSASALGVAFGPLAGSLLSEHAGFPVMGLVLGTTLVLLAAPLALVAVHTTTRPLSFGLVRRGGLAAPGTPPLPVPPLGTPEQPLAPLSVTGRHLTRRALSTAGPGTGPGAGGGAGDGG